MAKVQKNTDINTPNFDSRAWLRSGQCRRLGVFGSRTLDDERVETLILEKMHTEGFGMIVTCQEPQGVSEVAQRVAKKYGFPLEVHFLNMRYLRGAFEQRSKEIVAMCDEFLIIHDGESKGTANEMKLAQKHKRPYQYERLEPSKYSRSVGFNIDVDWGGDADDGDEMLRDLNL